MPVADVSLRSAVAGSAPPFDVAGVGSVPRFVGAAWPVRSAPGRPGTSARRLTGTSASELPVASTRSPRHTSPRGPVDFGHVPSRPGGMGARRAARPAAFSQTAARARACTSSGSSGSEVTAKRRLLDCRHAIPGAGEREPAGDDAAVRGGASALPPPGGPQPGVHRGAVRCVPVDHLAARAWHGAAGRAAHRRPDERGARPAPPTGVLPARPSLCLGAPGCQRGPGQVARPHRARVVVRGGGDLLRCPRGTEICP